MRIRDLLLETSHENYEISQIAEFIANNINQYIKKMLKHNHAVKYFTVSLISDILGIPAPNVSSPNVKILISESLIFNITPTVKYAAFSYTANHYDPNYIGTIEKNLETFKEFRSTTVLSSALTHELQHALDYIKSQSKGSPDHNLTPDAIGLDAYMRHPNEINARFAEVLYALSKYPVNDKQLLVVIINHLFSQYKLTTALWPVHPVTLDNPLAQKTINRLKSRAYKFYDEVMLKNTPPTDPQAKKTWLSNIKSLIKNFISNTKL